MTRSCTSNLYLGPAVTSLLVPRHGIYTFYPTWHYQDGVQLSPDKVNPHAHSLTSVLAAPRHGHLAADTTSQRLQRAPSLCRPHSILSFDTPVLPRGAQLIEDAPNGGFGSGIYGAKHSSLTSSSLEDDGEVGDKPPAAAMKKAFQLVVKTGDQEGAGTDANVWVVLEDERGRATPRVKLDKMLYNDLERSKRDTYNVDCPEDFSRVARIRLSRDSRGIADDWFCDYIHVEDRRNNNKRKISKDTSSKGIRNFLGSACLKENAGEEKTVYFFPIHRWVAPRNDYIFDEYGVCLPHHDVSLEARKADLQKKRESYNYIVHAPGMVAQVSRIVLSLLRGSVKGSTHQG